MKRKILKICTIVSAASIIAAVAVGGATAQSVTWKMASAWGRSLPIVGPSGERIETLTRTLSNGNFVIEFHEPGALVPPLEAFDAVRIGSIDAVYGSPGYWTSKEPVLAFFGSVPFGPDIAEYLAWMKNGGGYEIYDEIYAKFGLKGLICGYTAPESSGWFRKEVNSVEDLKGLKMRFFGLGGRVMQKLGVSTQLLAGPDIYPALERGVIDATEYSVPLVDQSAGFHQVAKHNYYPGWHQQATLHELLMNRSKYDALSDDQKMMLQVVCESNVLWSIIEMESNQFKAMAELKEKGVQIHRWSDEMLSSFEKAWREVVAEESEKSPLFKRVWDSLSTFRESHRIWRDNALVR